MTASPSRTRRRVPQHQLSLVRGTREHWNEPGYQAACIACGGFVQCVECFIVVGIGTDKLEAENDAAKNKTGVKTKDGWRCSSCDKKPRVE